MALVGSPRGGVSAPNSTATGSGGGGTSFEDFLKTYAPNGGPTAPSAQNPMVYLGGSAPTGGSLLGAPFKNPTGKVGVGVLAGAPNLDTVDNTKMQFYQWSPEERSAWGRRLYEAGILKDPNDYSGMLQAWQQAVEEAGNFYTFGKKKVTPWNVIDMISGGGEGTGRKATTVTNRQKVFNTPTEEDLNAMVKAVYHNALGRDPDKGEMSRYASMLKRQYEAHPALQTSTTHTDTKGNSNTTSRTSGGYSADAAQDYALNKAQADPEWGAYQAATTYFNALVNAIGAPG